MPDEMISIRIEGDEQVAAAFAAAPGLARALFDRAARQGLQSLEGVLKPYPPQPPRDRAKTFNTYVRGIGRFPKSAFVGAQRKGRGAYKPGPRGGQVRRTSEQLGKRWQSRVYPQAVGITAMLSNPVSYAQYVQGEKQPYYHLQTGWKTVWAARLEKMGEIVQRFRDAARALVDAVKRMMAG
jgi:hypothetical protein